MPSKDAERAFGSDDPRGAPEFGELLARYVEELSVKGFVDPDEILRDHPELGPAILEDLETYAQLESENLSFAPLGTLGDYTLRREIGRGGMGVVYEAWQNSMDRPVALKVLPPGVAADNRACMRFLREAKTTGKLHHQNIVPVYSVGIEANTPYYSMEHVEGETLAQILARLRKNRKDRPNETPDDLLPTISRRFRRSAAEARATAELEGESKHDAEEREESTASPVRVASTGVFDTTDPNLIYYARMAEAFAGVAEGLQHAHERGVIHRDLKPSNLILDTEGKLRILDFGLAHLEGQESLTLSGDLLGTVLYMSPEQALARRVPVDRRSDIYSLGATFYEMLTWKPPFQGADHQETISRIIFSEPEPPRRVHPRIPRDLETIVLKCLEKDPASRYRSAEALAQDLRRFLKSEAIEATPRSALDKVARTIRRYRGRIAVSAVVALLVAVSGLFVYKLWLDEQDRRNADYEHSIRTLQMKLSRHGTTLRAGSPDLKPIDRHSIVFPDDFKLLHGEANPVAEAVEALKVLSATFPSRFEAPFYLARGEKLLGRKDEALEALETTLERNAGFVPARILKAELESRENAAALARSLLDSYAAEDWQHVWARARLATRERRWSDAARDFEHLRISTELKPEGEQEVYVGASMDFRLERGLALLRAGEFLRAIEEFVIIRDREPDYMEPALLLGKSYYLYGDPRGAEETFEELHKRFGSEGALWIALMYLSLSAGSVSAGSVSVSAEEQGRAWAAKVERTHEKDSTPERIMAWANRAPFDATLPAAESSARDAIKINPRDTVALFMLAFSAYWKHG